MDEFKIEAVQKHSPGAAAAAAKLAKGCVGVMAGSLLLSSCFPFVMIGMPYTSPLRINTINKNEEPIPGLLISPSWAQESQYTDNAGYTCFYDSAYVGSRSITITDVDDEENGSYAEKVFDIPDEGEFHIVTMEEATTDEQ